jgi:hypothetical protein
VHVFWAVEGGGGRPRRALKHKWRRQAHDVTAAELEHTQTMLRERAVREEREDGRETSALRRRIAELEEKAAVRDAEAKRAAAKFRKDVRAAAGGGSPSPASFVRALAPSPAASPTRCAVGVSSRSAELGAEARDGQGQERGQARARQAGAVRERAGHRAQAAAAGQQAPGHAQRRQRWGQRCQSGQLTLLGPALQLAGNGAARVGCAQPHLSASVTLSMPSPL